CQLNSLQRAFPPLALFRPVVFEMKDSLRTRLPSRQRHALCGLRSAPRRSMVHSRFITAEVLEERLLLSAVDTSQVAVPTIQPLFDANSTTEPMGTAGP